MQDQSPTGAPGANERVQPYAYFALAVLTGAGILNFIDRHILSILAEDVKHDLQLTDSQLGFLLGTAFAVFYAVCGVAMGRIADAIDRTKLMASGLGLWSLMTALGGGATNYATLSATRIGVGIGEATANPCSHSLISDYFPPRRRAAALGTYLVSIYAGGALSLIIGGLVLQHWNSGMCQAAPFAGACDLAAWKATLILVGVAGLPLAVMVYFLREPPRPKSAIPLGRLVLREFGAAVPPFTLVSLFGLGGGKAILHNLALILAVVAVAAGLIALTHDWAQWVAIAIGAYSVLSWTQVHALRDRPLYKLTFGCPTFLTAMLGSALFASAAAAVHAWAAVYAMRELNASPASAGVSLGLTFAIAGGVTVVTSGWIADQWKTRDKGAPLWLALIGVLALPPCLAVMLLAKDMASYVAAYFVLTIFASCWSGGFAAMVQDLVLPRMRGAASAAFALLSTVVGAAGGPYVAGKVSTLTGSLSVGMMSVQVLCLIAAILFIVAGLRLRRETPEGRRQRAETAGEPPLEAARSP
jgi:MFS family permease